MPSDPNSIIYTALALGLGLNLIILLKLCLTNKGKQAQAMEQLNQQLIKQQQEQEQRLGEKLHQHQIQNYKDLAQFNHQIEQNVGNKVDKISQKVEDRLDHIHLSIEQRLDQSLQKSNATFTSIMERLAKIDQAQKNIEGLSNNIVSLQDILSDKKSRGTFGEVQLNQILYSSFGDEHQNTYQTQYKFNTGNIADAVLFAPEPLGCIAIDSKFPLEHYKQSVDRKLSESERKEASQAFKQDLKKHVDAIASKYIIPGTTANQAILFLPAEAIFAELNAYYGSSIEYAQSKRVWIASPTTLMAVLSTLQIILRNAKREKYAKEIHQQLIKLGEEFKRYQTRWTTLAADINKVTRDINDINITSDKISKKFAAIDQVEEKTLLTEQTPSKNIASSPHL